MNHTVNIDIKKILPHNSKYFVKNEKWYIQSIDPDILASGDNLETTLQNYWIQWGMDTYENLTSVKTDKDNELEDYKKTLRSMAYSYIELSHDKTAYQRDDFVKKAKEILEKYRKPISSPPISVIERDF